MAQNPSIAIPRGSVPPRPGNLAGRRRLLIKAALAACLALLFLVWCGWHFGLRPTPGSLRAVSLPEPTAALGPEFLGPSNVWYWLREVQRLQASGTSAAKPSGADQPTDVLMTLARRASEAADAGRPAGLSGWRLEFASPSVGAPKPNPGGVIPVADCGVWSASIQPVWDNLLPAPAASTRPEDLFLLWRIHARTTANPQNADLWDEDAAGRLRATLLPRWHDSVMEAVKGDLPGLLALLEQANRLEDTLQPLQLAYWAEAQVSVGTWRGFADPDWTRVFNDARGSVAALGDSALGWARCLAVGEPPASWGGSKRARPGAFASLTLALQQACVSRRAAMATERALLHAQLLWCAAPLDGPETGPPAAVATWLEGFNRPGGILRWLDRPALRLMPGVYPSAARARAYRRAWIACWRAAHLTLALKCHQLQEGCWPASLERLESVLKTRLRPDPYTGRAFLYQLEPGGRSWEITMAGAAEPGNHPGGSGVLLRGKL